MAKKRTGKRPPASSRIERPARAREGPAQGFLRNAIVPAPKNQADDLNSALKRMGVLEILVKNCAELRLAASERPERDAMDRLLPKLRLEMEKAQKAVVHEGLQLLEIKVPEPEPSLEELDTRVKESFAAAEEAADRLDAAERREAGDAALQPQELEAEMDAAHQKAVEADARRGEAEARVTYGVAEKAVEADAECFYCKIGVLHEVPQECRPDARLMGPTEEDFRASLSPKELALYEESLKAAAPPQEPTNPPTPHPGAPS